MKIFLTVIVASIGLVVGQGDQAPTTEKAVKPSLVFQGKTYFLGGKISAGRTMVVNSYYREGEGPNKLGAHMRQRFILTKDTAKAVAVNMSKSFEKRGKVALVDDVSPGITGMVATEAGEKASFVTVSIFEPAQNGKGVFVKSWEIVVSAMPKEKLEGIAAKFQKSTLEALVNTKFPKIILPPKK